MDDDRTDAELWLEATSGTEASFAAIYHRHRHRVFRKAYSRVRNTADAEDIVAVVFLEAWRSRTTARIVDGSLLPWLLTVTTHATLNNLRSSRRYRKLLLVLPPPSDEPDLSENADERLDGQADGVKVTQALRQLSRIDRTVVDLCLIEQMPVGVAARVLDVPVGTVKSRLSRARSRIQALLAEMPPTVVKSNEDVEEA